MAELRGILSKLSGSAGQFTFKRVNGHTIMSEKASITTVRRSRAQQLHRMKWPNLIKAYAGIAPLLNCAFENKSKSVSDYNMFVKVNFADSKVYLTKSEVVANACVVAPYLITMGTLPTIQCTGEAGFSAVGGKLACELGDGFQGAYAWVHLRKQQGTTRVSTQMLIAKNDLLDSYTSEEAYKRAVATYGGEDNNFLTPDGNSTAKPAPSDGGGSEGDNPDSL